MIYLPKGAGVITIFAGADSVLPPTAMTWMYMGWLSTLCRGMIYCVSPPVRSCSIQAPLSPCNVGATRSVKSKKARQQLLWAQIVKAIPIWQPITKINYGRPNAVNGHRRQRTHIFKTLRTSRSCIVPDGGKVANTIFSAATNLDLDLDLWYSIWFGSDWDFNMLNPDIFSARKKHKLLDCV